MPPVSLKALEGRAAGCEVDGVFYHRTNTDDIPSGTASVYVKVDDNGEVHYTGMVAGLAGIQATSSIAERGEGEGRSLNCLQPVAGWWMIEVDPPGDGEAPASQSMTADDDSDNESFVTMEQALGESADG